MPCIREHLSAHNHNSIIGCNNSIRHCPSTMPQNMQISFISGQGECISQDIQDATQEEIQDQEEEGNKTSQSSITKCRDIKRKRKDHNSIPIRYSPRASKNKKITKKF
eukprot:12317528-Ditylum_brightwellii.AAC.1